GEPMPHTTHGYPFEAKIAGFAHELCRRFSSDVGLRSFLLVLDENGNVRSLTFDSPFQAIEDVRNGQVPHIFFDPFEDGMEYFWLSWHKIARVPMERLVGQLFVESDFVRYLDCSRAPELQPAKTYPTSWGVMF